MRTIVTADIGGTHARFALAEIGGGQVVALGEPVTLRTADHASFQLAWQEFGRRAGIALPNELAIAFAGPVDGDVLKLTNNPWMIRPYVMKERLGVERFIIVNDFGAVGHAVATLGDEHFRHLCGPDYALPDDGVISIVGPGTGLGVAALLRKAGSYEVIETEGGHLDFAPLEALEDKILKQLRRKFRRVSVERVASGQGLRNLYEALGAIEKRDLAFHDDADLWPAALDGSDSLASAALDRLCLTLGAVAGDMALAHGASAVVIAGGVGLRLADHLPQSGFRDRFIAKGRFERRMDDMPVRLITYPQPGLFGAAAAFAREYP
ncbi:glucokinase [Sphingomonas sp.]|uniref:glucokinase n=1 Tax=Sphingomonas sp. TaxID=28214 RepID=UPI00286A0888|nr:glucokinase [Sphingomonas sp.]